MKDMKEYVKPEIEVTCFTEDVITTSVVDNEHGAGDVLSDEE
jgi:hypothetical protein